MNSPIRITAVRKAFDPEAFAAVLVAAALAHLDEEQNERETDERDVDAGVHDE